MASEDIINSFGETDAVRAFFDQWHIFQKVIDNNYLFHRETENVLKDYLARHYAGKISFADLGCGDAQIITRVLSGIELANYAAVDLSDIALKIAEENTRHLSGEKMYLCNDFLGSLEALKFRPNVIWIGLSFHHLQTEDKKNFLQKAYAVLDKDGCFIIHDSVIQEGQDRNHYLDALEHQFRTAYKKLTDDELKSCVAHIRSADFPETLSDYQQWGLQAGFATVESIYTDPTGICQTVVFQKC